MKEKNIIQKDFEDYILPMLKVTPYIALVIVKVVFWVLMLVVVPAAIIGLFYIHINYQAFIALICILSWLVYWLHYGLDKMEEWL